MDVPVYRYRSSESHLLQAFRSSSAQSRSLPAPPSESYPQRTFQNLPPLPRATVLLKEMAAVSRSYIEAVRVSTFTATDDKNSINRRFSVPQFLAGANLPPEAAAVIAKGKAMAAQTGDTAAAAASIAPALLAILKSQQTALMAAVTELEEMKVRARWLPFPSCELRAVGSPFTSMMLLLCKGRRAFSADRQSSVPIGQHFCHCHPQSVLLNAAA